MSVEAFMALTTTSLDMGNVVAMSPRVTRGSGFTSALQGRRRRTRAVATARGDSAVRPLALHASCSPCWLRAAPRLPSRPAGGPAALAHRTPPEFMRQTTGASW